MSDTENQSVASRIVDAVLSERPADIVDIAHETMTERTHELVKDLRESVEGSMFVSEETVEIEIDDEVYEIPVSVAEEILSEDEEFSALIEAIGEDELTEEQEQELVELSKDTLRSYLDKAKISGKRKRRAASAALARGDRDGLRLDTMADVRFRGIERAKKKIGEEIENIDELSVSKLAHYIGKASADVEKKKAAADQYRNADDHAYRATDGIGQRHYDPELVNASRSFRKKLTDKARELDDKSSRREWKGIERAKSKISSDSWTRVKASPSAGQPHGPNKASPETHKAVKKAEHAATAPNLSDQQKKNRESALRAARANLHRETQPSDPADKKKRS